MFTVHLIFISYYDNEYPISNMFYMHFSIAYTLAAIALQLINGHLNWAYKSHVFIGMPSSYS